MPYIAKDRRKELDYSIDVLVVELRDKSGAVVDGEVNYVITQLLRKTYRVVGYAIFNRVIGVLECVKLEFYRRQIAPYEDKKKEENGDVY